MTTMTMTISPPRTELMHHYDGSGHGALRQGDMKLIIGTFSPYCWHGNYPDEPGKTCKPGKPDPRPVDWHCTPCKDTQPKPCADGQPCLFNITADEGEHHDLAAVHPEIVQKMLARYSNCNWNSNADALLLTPSLPCSFASSESRSSYTTSPPVVTVGVAVAVAQIQRAWCRHMHTVC